MNTTSRVLGMAMALLTVAAQARDRAAKSKPSEWALAQAREQRYQAGLRAEANAPGPTKQEYARVRAVLAAQKDREDREIARYEQYKFEQKIALAEASASKTYVATDSQPTAEVNTTRFSAPSKHSGIKTVAYATRHNVSEVAQAAPIMPYLRSRGITSYPAHFARRAAQEEGVDRQDAMLYAQQAREDAQALLESPPFGIPIPGRPGYISSPPQRFQGYIDVRDYSPGTIVTDPYTKQPVRVP